jgi:hypothetical protein
MHQIKTHINPMTFTDNTFSEVIKEISQATGKECQYADRETFMFGYCPRFVFKDSDPLYCLGRTLYTWTELREHLRDNWRPAKQDEQDYFIREIA